MIVAHTYGAVYPQQLYYGWGTGLSWLTAEVVVGTPVGGPTALTPVASRNLAEPVISASMLSPIASRNQADV